MLKKYIESREFRDRQNELGPGHEKLFDPETTTFIYETLIKNGWRICSGTERVTWSHVGHGRHADVTENAYLLQRKVDER